MKFSAKKIKFDWCNDDWDAQSKGDRDSSLNPPKGPSESSPKRVTQAPPTWRGLIFRTPNLIPAYVPALAKS
jgi:hypothetical protein